jgi:hypothetical protein
MNTTTFEPALDDFERRVKPKVEDAALQILPETPTTHNKNPACKPEETVLQSPIVESVNTLDIIPCDFSILNPFKSDGSPAPAPSGDATHCSDSVSCPKSPAFVLSVGVAADNAGCDTHQGDVAVGDQKADLPHVSQICATVACSGGESGQCSTPHLPVKVKGMCRLCYQRDWYHRNKVSANISPKTLKMKSEYKRPTIDPGILCDDFGVPILDKFGIPIQVRQRATIAFYLIPPPPFPVDPCCPPQAQTRASASLARCHGRRAALSPGTLEEHRVATRCTATVK